MNTTISNARPLPIDGLRGAALVMIFINHMHGHFASLALTTRNYGLSDAAELFVFCFGFAAARAYAKFATLSGASYLTLKLVTRAVRIYTAHIVLFVLVAATINWAGRTLDSRYYIEVVNVSSFFDYTQETLPAVLSLAYQPSFLDILPLYLVLFSFVPIFCVAVRFGIPVLLGLSAVIYTVTAWTSLSDLFHGWHFHPFYWQTTAALGFAAACAPSTLTARVLRSRALLFGVCTYLLFSLMVAAPWRRLDAVADLVIIPWEWLGTVAKTKLSLWRIAHVAALLYVLARIASRCHRWSESRIIQAMALLGRHSLHVFCLGVVLSILGHIAMVENGYAVSAQIGVLIVGLLALYGAAAFLDTVKRVRVPAGTHLIQPT